MCRRQISLMQIEVVPINLGKTCAMLLRWEIFFLLIVKQQGCTRIDGNYGNINDEKLTPSSPSPPPAASRTINEIDAEIDRLEKGALNLRSQTNRFLKMICGPAKAYPPGRSLNASRQWRISPVVQFEHGRR